MNPTAARPPRPSRSGSCVRRRASAMWRRA
jgi:hypothetical protein